MTETPTPRPPFTAEQMMEDSKALLTEASWWARQEGDGAGADARRVAAMLTQAASQARVLAHLRETLDETRRLTDWGCQNTEYRSGTVLGLTSALSELARLLRESGL